MHPSRRKPEAIKKTSDSRPSGSNSTWRENPRESTESKTPGTSSTMIPAEESSYARNWPSGTENKRETGKARYSNTRFVARPKSHRLRRLPAPRLRSVVEPTMSRFSKCEIAPGLNFFHSRLCPLSRSSFVKFPIWMSIFCQGALSAVQAVHPYTKAKRVILSWPWWSAEYGENVKGE